MNNQTTTPRAGLGNGCALYKKCGGCQLQNLTYAQQLDFKQGREIALLGKYCHVSPIVGMAQPTHYRCKVQAAFGMERGRVISGVYQSSSHRIVPVDSCALEDEGADAVIVAIRRLLVSFKLGVFDERTQRGFLRHVLVRKGLRTGQVMVVMVTGTRQFPKHHDFVKALLRERPEITTVVQSVNDKFTNLVLGDTFTTLYGPGYIEDELCDCRFRISPGSFYQVNPRQTEILYSLAVEEMALTGSETVVDAYCGTGTIGLIAARKAGKVIGVELSRDAVRDARVNARLCNAANATFFCGDATKFLCGMAEAGDRADVIVMDPPRAGSTEAFMAAAARVAPARIVYVSCDPQTLSRDLGFLTRHGYRAAGITPVDMFPHTSHVETVVLMSRVEGK